MIVEGKDSSTVELRNNTVMLNHHNGTWEELLPKDTGLELFVIKSLKLERRQEKEGGGVRMVLRMERKAFREIMTTYVPSAMLMATTFATIFFSFGDAVAALMTIILVMQGIFTSKIETLPPSSELKMLDIWLIGCFVYPFLEMILRTIRENYEQQDEDGGNQDTDKKEETAADVTERGSEKKAMPETRQPSGRRVSPLLIQVESREAEGTGPPMPWVAGCWDLLTKKTDYTILSFLNTTGE
jgi:hypothetical protein